MDTDSSSYKKPSSGEETDLQTIQLFKTENKQLDKYQYDLLDENLINDQ